MSAIICHLNGNYNIYSTVMDTFCFDKSISLTELTRVIQRYHGQQGLDQLPARLERAHKNGHSGFEGGTLEEFLDCNRAGEDEAFLSYDECVARFLS